MGLRLVVGRAGSGKTSFCLKEITAVLKESADAPALILLTPEQATLQMEQDLHRAIAPDSMGFSRVQVLSFRRLAWRVFQEAGGAARPHLGEMGKRMALRSILNTRQDSLTLFAPLADSPGFVEQLAHTVAELKLYRITPEKLQQAFEYFLEEQGGTILTRKLHDLAVIYKELETFLAGRYLDPDDYLGLLAQRVREAEFLKDSQVWVDGFNGFTPQEELVLQALMTVSSRVTVTLCLDPILRCRLLGETEMFHPTSQTYHRLHRLAVEVEAAIEDDVILDGKPPRFKSSPVLSHLEANFGCWPLRPFKGEPAGIKLVAAANRRVEVEAAAREIIRLAREENLRWREMAVLVRDLEPYHSLIVNTFRDFNIPLFIDRRRPVGHHPLIELVRAAMEVVLENWSYDAVFRYLKTDLVPVSRRETDLLENYVLAHGIRGSKWLDSRPWQYKSTEAEEDIEALHKIRVKASSGLIKFYKACRNGDLVKVRGITAALFNLLQELEVPRQLEEWCRQATAAGELDNAQEHEQVWNGLVDLLDELVVTLEDTPLTIREYAAILDTGLRSLKLRLIPPALDQVIVGTLDRSRQPELKAGLILGVGEGVLPARVSQDATFNDREREKLTASGIELAPTGSLRLFHEEFLTYLALTRSRRFLWLSYPMADSEGKALAPSSLIRRLRQLLPGLREEYVSSELPGDEEAGLQLLTTPRQAAGYLAVVLSCNRILPPLWREVYCWLMQDKDRDYWQSLLRGAGYLNQVDRLEPEIAALLYPEILVCSISQLETYAACPFRYFLAYGLRLKERSLYQVDSAEMGKFYHDALKSFVEELKTGNRDWGELSDAEVADITARVVKRLALDVRHEILTSSARYHYLLRKLEKTLKRSVEVLTEHARRGCFRPLVVEAYFGYGGELPPLVLATDDGRQVVLEGRIDRIDIARHEDKAYLRVIDYKSSSVPFDMENIYYGLSLQLPLYLQVALEAAPKILGEAAEPAGILYFAVKNSILRQKGPVQDAGELVKLRLRELKPRGLFLAQPGILKLMDKDIDRSPDLLPVQLNKDGNIRRGSPVVDRQQMAGLLALACRRAVELAKGILAGQIEISPYFKNRETGCGFCAYRPVCSFDPQLPGADYRRLKGIGEDFWRLPAEGLGKGEGHDE